jgi:protein TonB
MPWRVLAALVLLLAPLQAVSQQEVPALIPADVDVRPKVIEKRLPFGDPPSALFVQPFVVQFVIETSGGVNNIRVLRSADGPPPFQDEYLALLGKWKFEPGRKGGVPVRVAVRLRAEAQATRPPLRSGTSLLKVQVPPMEVVWNIDGVDDDFAAGVDRVPAPGLLMPSVTREVKPVIPPDAMRAHAAESRRRGFVRHSVELELLVSVKGNVSAARVIRSTDARFDSSALAAARQWLFKPATRAGEPVPVVVNLVLEFALAG